MTAKTLLISAVLILTAFPVRGEFIVKYHIDGHICAPRGGPEAFSTWTYVGPWPETPASIAEEAKTGLGATLAPNPSIGFCSILFSLDMNGPRSVEILDVSGKVIRQLLEGRHPAGDYSLKWDGRNDDGRKVSAGVYFGRIESVQGTVTQRVTLVE